MNYLRYSRAGETHNSCLNLSAGSATPHPLYGLFTGCIVRHGDFSVLSNKLIRTSDFEPDKADRAKGIEGEETQYAILCIPIGGPPTLEGALDDTFERGGRCYDRCRCEDLFHLDTVYICPIWLDCEGGCCKDKEKIKRAAFAVKQINQAGGSVCVICQQRPLVVP